MARHIGHRDLLWRGALVVVEVEVEVRGVSETNLVSETNFLEYIWRGDLMVILSLFCLGT